MMESNRNGSWKPSKRWRLLLFSQEGMFQDRGNGQGRAARASLIACACTEYHVDRR